ncbi:TIGR04141 family sporadically distributed protein [Chryseobacterium mucoviscidosis]|uniref:Sporadically distributed protein, TIGR04141 family n=1 Tax=Chryseobacterium mucoviscidosis TaxID=1945581 RepID=A0A202BXW6_9FLAO|nr:TIGR04141 family sporadically distributed protein [Chryseobacterium mucoviscidosis]OVE56326.1 hypothetical protein B0E34_12335 [Chryseobacterium mucoviscidosis]
MPKFNIYKVLKVNERSLIKKLHFAGLKNIDSKNIGETKLDFYLSTNPELVDIWWTEYYFDFFINRDIPQNKIFFGCLIIHNDSYCYVISLGKTHFYLKEFCDLEFGINLAERIIDIENMKLKNSKFYKSQKNKSITSFSNNTILDYDSGESLHFIKAKTISSDLWGNIASFGHSVQLNIDLQINEIPKLIQRIEKVLKEKKIINFPKADLIKDSIEIDRLDELIAIAIRDYNSDVSNDEFDLSGIDFIFTNDSHFKFNIKGTEIESDLFNELSIDYLRDFIEDNQVNILKEINNIQVKFLREEGRSFSKPLKAILQFVTDDRETLIDGKWHKFNQSYIDLLNDKVRKIPLRYDSIFDIEKNETETEFNEKRVVDGYLNIHTEFVQLAKKYKVEKMDLYKDGTLFFVKKGTLQKLNYVIDQALNTLQLLKHNEFKIISDDEELLITKINTWILVDNVKKVNDLSQFRSLIFIMKMNELYRQVTDAGLILECNINYIKKIQRKK